MAMIRPASARVRVGRRPGWVAWTLAPLAGMVFLAIPVLPVAVLVDTTGHPRQPDLAPAPGWQQFLTVVAFAGTFGGLMLLLWSWAAAAFMFPLGGQWLTGSTLVEWSVAGRHTIDLDRAGVAFRNEHRIGDLLVLTDQKTGRVINVLLPRSAAAAPGLPAVAAALSPRRADPHVGAAVRYLQERLTDGSPTRWEPIPADLVVPESWREKRSTRRFLRGLLGGPGIGFLAVGLGTLIPSVLLMFSSTTVPATVIDHGSGTVRFVLHDGTVQIAALPRRPSTLRDGQQITIDYLPADPRLIQTTGSHEELLSGLLFTSIATALLWGTTRLRPGPAT